MIKRKIAICGEIKSIITSSYTFYHLIIKCYEHTIIIYCLYRSASQANRFITIIIISSICSWQVVVCYLSIHLSDYLWLHSSYQCLVHSGQHILFVVLNDVITSRITILNQNWYKIEMISYEFIQHKESQVYVKNIIC